MKVEKINDNQIRCILTQGELLKHHLNLHSLASGDGDAMGLIREALTQSAEELGVEFKEGPLMIEAAPSGDGMISLTITKMSGNDDAALAVQADALLRALQHIAALAKSREEENREAPAEEPAPAAVFCFDAGRPLCLPGTLASDPAGVHTALYFAPKLKQYYLLVSASAKQKEAFSRLCFLLSEFGRSLPAGKGTKAYFDEHYRCIYGTNALKALKDNGGLPAEKEQ